MLGPECTNAKFGNILKIISGNLELPRDLIANEAGVQPKQKYASQTRG